MLCCVSKKAVATSDRGGPPYYCLDNARVTSSQLPVVLEKIELELYPEEEDVPPILLPCAICARTFMPQSLEKHTKICERAATKKRKPFDSAKQRIQGTDLAEFLPIQQQQKKRSATEERISIGKPNSTWKQTHNEFLKAIRQARGESIDFTTQKQTSSPASSGAPMRANEKGMCPTCNRYFGIKAYDRHVAWCKERSTRLPISPATNVAKERLEARIKYRAPALRNRRPTNREKYSPSSAVALNVANNKTSPPLNNAKAKESISIPSCNKGNCNPIKQKAAVVRRVGQIREPSSGPMKSRPADRTNRPSEDCETCLPHLTHSVSPAQRSPHFPLSLLKAKKANMVEMRSSDPTAASPMSKKTYIRKLKDKFVKCEAASSRTTPNNSESKYQSSCTARSQKSNKKVSARSQGNPRLNDVTINEEVMSMIVQPCNIYNDNNLVTWRRMSCETSCPKTQRNEVFEVQENLEDFQLPDIILPPNVDTESLSSCEEKDLKESNTDLVDQTISKYQSNDLSPNNEIGTISWADTVQKVNRTYLIKDSVGYDDTFTPMNKKIWKPVKHSPRVEFCLKSPPRVLSTKLDDCETSPFDSGNDLVDTIASLNKNEPIDKYESRNDETITNTSNRSVRVKNSDQMLLSNRIQGESQKGVDDSTSYKADEFSNDEHNFVKIDREITRSNDGVSIDDEAIVNLETLSAVESITEVPTTRSIDETEQDAITRTKNDSNSSRSKPEDIEMNEEQCAMKKLLATNDASSDIPFLEQHEFPVESCSFEVQHIKDDISVIEENIHDSTNEIVDYGTLMIDQQESPNRNIVDENIDANEERETRDTSPPHRHLPDKFPSKDKYGVDDFQVKTNSPLNSTNIENQEDIVSRLSIVSIDFDRSFKNDTQNIHEEQYRNCSWRNNGIKLEKQPTTRREEIMDPAASLSTNNTKKEAIGKTKIQCSIVESSDKPILIEDSARESQKCGGASIDNDSSSTTTGLQVETKLRVSVESLCEISLQKRPRRYVMNARIEEKDLDASIDRGDDDDVDGDEDEVESKHRVLGNALLSRETAALTGNSNIGASGDGRSTARTNGASVTLHEELCKIYERYVNRNFNYDSDNALEERDAMEPGNKDGTEFSSLFVRNEEARRIDRSRVETRRNSLSSKSEVDRRSNSIGLKGRLCRNMNALRGSTDTLISSVEHEFTKRRQSLVESCYEQETIEKIETKDRKIRFRMLPEIKDRSKESKGDREFAASSVGFEESWERSPMMSRNRSISVDDPYNWKRRLFKRNLKARVLPPVPRDSSLHRQRKFDPPLRPVWNNYVRRRPDFNLVLRGRIGTCKDYDPFLLAEQQMNDLLSDSSDLSATDGGALPFKLDRALLPLSHSSAFIKYPHQRSVPPNLDKRTSLIAPPSEFDDLTSDFSSDSTETNSLSREIFLKDHRQGDLPREAISKTSETSRSSVRELGRRMIIDKSKALGGEVVEDRARRDSGDDGIKDTTSSSNIERTRKSAEKASTKATKPAVNRSHSVRASSAPKSTPERKNLVVKKTLASFASATVDNDSQKHANTNHSNKRNNNNYVVLAGSNLSLSSIVSSETDVKRSNSMFDELMTSFEDDGISFPSLRSFLKNESLSMSSPVHGCTRQINGQISDEELSSPDSYKRQDHKLSADSAYSSLNRKYFNHGRSANDMIDRINDQTSTTIYRDGYAISSASKAKCKLSKFCHECGSKFPETAKFCCQCGVKRLTF